jgi:hypothetical protein
MQGYDIGEVVLLGAVEGDIAELAKPGSESEVSPRFPKLNQQVAR